MKLSLAVVVAALMSGCMSARTAVVGRTANALGAGNVEIGLASGAQYVSGADFSSTSALSGSTSANTSSGSTRVQLPIAEGNAGLGITDTVDLNVHYSVAGVQPGLRVVIAKGPVTMAVMPELGLGLGFMNSWVQTTNPATGQTITSSGGGAAYNMLLGARFLASHENGFYGAFGYEHQRVGFTGSVGSGSTIVYHSLGAAGGYEWARGPLRIRPELSLSFSPAVSTGGTNFTEFLVMPNITVALLSPVFKLGAAPAPEAK